MELEIALSRPMMGSRRNVLNSMWLPVPRCHRTAGFSALAEGADSARFVLWWRNCTKIGLKAGMGILEFERANPGGPENLD